MRWVQDGARSTVSLDGPLGVGGVRIVNDAGALTLTTPSGEALDSQAAHDELVRRMGFEPPLDSLRYWVQGVPDPASSEHRDDRRAGLSGFAGAVRLDGDVQRLHADRRTAPCRRN